jgi:hypothetical protein
LRRQAAPAEYASLLRSTHSCPYRGERGRSAAEHDTEEAEAAENRHPGCSFRHHGGRVVGGQIEVRKMEIVDEESIAAHPGEEGEKVEVEPDDPGVHRERVVHEPAFLQRAAG